MIYRIFVTHIVPKKEILRYNLSIAACNFSYNLIESKAFDKVYSVLPTFVTGDVEKFDGLIHSSWRSNRLLHHLAPIAENIKLFFKIPKHSAIWYYNCTILNATLIVLLKLFKPSVKQEMIILDYTPSTKPLERFFLWLINRMDGAIKLADSSLFTCRNTVCLPGIVPANSVKHSKVKDIKPIFLISGALGDNIAMLPMLLEVFSIMPKMTLHITGKAPDKELVEQYTKKHKNIVYHGMVEYEEYLRILHYTTFLLSTRNPDFSENQCNFPSKIIEALLHNRIIVSTLHYSQLEGIRYFEVASTIHGFATDLQSITSLPQEETIQYANQADEVKKRFNSKVWKEWMEKIENR